MKTCLLLLLLFCAAHSFAQGVDIQKQKPWEEFKKQHPEFDRHEFKPMLAPKFVPKTGVAPTRQDEPMPIAKAKLTPVKIGNNGKGADVYAMMPYNMPCLMPDSTFHSNMPVKGFERVTLNAN